MDSITGARIHLWRGERCTVSLTADAREAGKLLLSRHATCALNWDQANTVWPVLLAAAAANAVAPGDHVYLNWGRLATPADDALALAASQQLARGAAASADWDRGRGRPSRSNVDENEIARAALSGSAFLGPVTTFFKEAGFSIVAVHVERVLVADVAAQPQLRHLREEIGKGRLPYDAAIEIQFARRPK